MNRDIEQSSNAMVAGAECSRDVVARAAGRIQRWFRGSEHEPSNRDLNLHREERLRERDGIAGELLLMQRVMDRGRDVLRGLRSSAIETTSLERALSGLREELAAGCGVRFRIFVKGQPKL